MSLDRNGLEVLDHSECLRLMSTVSICRVGVSFSALPAILPVNFALLDGKLIIRSAEGTKLNAALRNTVVAVEADNFEPDGSAGWSVLVRGRSYELTRGADIDAAQELDLQPWAGEFDRYIAIHTENVSGRRICTR